MDEASRGIRKHRQREDSFTVSKLRATVLEWLDAHEADLCGDFRPDSEAWRQLLADALAGYIFASLRKDS